MAAGRARSIIIRERPGAKSPKRNDLINLEKFVRRPAEGSRRNSKSAMSATIRSGSKRGRAEIFTGAVRSKISRSCPFSDSIRLPSAIAGSASARENKPRSKAKDTAAIAQSKAHVENRLAALLSRGGESTDIPLTLSLFSDILMSGRGGLLTGRACALGAGSLQILCALWN